nr:hypothetical protein OG781_04735 [Streptomyces sp. NBC_00830]
MQLGLLPRPVPAREEAERLAQAQQLASVWPTAVSLRPVDGEVLWIYEHCARRGVLEPVLPDGAADLTPAAVSAPAIASAPGSRPSLS